MRLQFMEYWMTNIEQEIAKLQQQIGEKRYKKDMRNIHLLIKRLEDLKRKQKNK